VKRYLFAALLFAAALPAAAQTNPAPAPRVFRSELELQFFRYDNFFQARGTAPTQDVNAEGAEYRLMYQPTATAPEIFGALFTTKYANGASSTSYGGRVGLDRYTAKHGFYGYVERTRNGYSYELGETRANATLTDVFASYSYQPVPKWEVGVNPYFESTTFNTSAAPANHFWDVEGEGRYRGFGRIFEPRVGYAIGQQGGGSSTDRYRYSHWSLQARTRPNDRLDLSVRFRHRTRDFYFRNVDENRRQVQFRGTYKFTPRLAGTGTFTREHIDSSLPGGDFNTGRLYAGLIIGF